MVDLADIAAATTAGYKEVVLDRGAVWTASSRFEVTLEKNLLGGAGSGFPFRGFGVGSSQANAEAQALGDLTVPGSCVTTAPGTRRA